MCERADSTQQTQTKTSLDNIIEVDESISSKPAANRKAEYYEMMHSEALAILNQYDVNEVLQQIVVRAAKLFDAPHGLLFTGENFQEMELKAAIGAFSSLDKTRMKYDQVFSRHVWQTGQPYCVEDYSVWEMRTFSQNVKTMMGVPLKSHMRVTGVLCLAFNDKRKEVAEKELLWLNRFAELVAIALDNARLYSATIEMTEDVDAWVRAEEKIRLLSLAVDQSPGIVIITDTGGNITYVNAKYSQVTGYSFEEVAGKNPRIIASGMHSDEFYKNLWCTIASGNEWSGELCDKTKNGDLFWSLTSISPVTSQSGEIAHYLAVQQDITELKRLQDNLFRLATTDELTGSVNRRQFMEIGKREIDRSLRLGHPLSVLYIDIDHFKQINDTYGHSIGDKTLQWFAGHALKRLRNYDVLGRLGGDEFAILLPETGVEQAYQVAMGLQTIFKVNSMLVGERGERIHLTLSIGIASQTEDNVLLDEVLKKADIALYRAKRSGKNRVRVYERGANGGGEDKANDR